MDHVENRKELIVITATSSGIGNATVKLPVNRAYYILAGVLNADDAAAIRAVNIEPIILDITNVAQIANLVKRIANDFEQRPLKVLINNAAIEMNTLIETITYNNGANSLK